MPDSADRDPAALQRALVTTFSDPFLSHDRAAATLAAALRPGPAVDPAGRAAELMAWFDDAARPLFGIADSGLMERATAVRDVLAEHLPVPTCVDDHRGLMLDLALVRGGAHPLLLAIVGHELARRAGVSSTVAHGFGEDWTVILGEDRCVAIGSGRTVGHAAARLGVCCPHEAAHRIASAVARRTADPIAHRAARVRDVLEVLEGAPRRRGPSERRV